MVLTSMDTLNERSSTQTQDVYLVIWWSIAATLLLVTSGSVPLLAFWWCSKKRSSLRCYETVPKFQMIPFVGYWQIVASIFRRKYPRSYLLQLLHAVCKMQESARITMFWLTVKPVIIFYKPETVEVLLNNSVTITKSAEYDYLKPWLGEGLLTSTGEKWRFQRKMLTPAFHFQILDNFMSVFDKQASILAKKLEKAVGEPWIDLHPHITMCTLDIVCHTMLGVQINAQSGCCKEYVQSIHEINDLMIHRIVRPWLWPDFIFSLFPSGRRFQQNVDRILHFTRQVIKEKKEALQKQIQDGTSMQTRKTLLELLVECHLKDSSLTEEDIREQVDTFIFEIALRFLRMMPKVKAVICLKQMMEQAHLEKRQVEHSPFVNKMCLPYIFVGHDTTSMSIFWTLYELGRHPDIQEKVYQESKNIFEGDNERPTTINDLKQMKYLDCVIKESLRMYPPVLMIARQLHQDLKFGNYVLKPDCSCVIAIIVLHMDPEQFPQPDVFNPDRFLPENSFRRHPFAYIPFSAGPRNCIGQRFAKMELKTVISHLIRRFKVTALDPHDKIEKMIGLVLKSAKPIRFKLELRA